MIAALREEIIARSQGRCQWPQCAEPGKEIAHLHSRGMGGNREKRDVAGNLMFLCRDHARISDGEMGSGGPAQYRLAHIQLLGAGVFDGMSLDRRGWERAEALRRYLLSRYPLIDEQA